MVSVMGAAGLEGWIFGPQWWYTGLYWARISSLIYLLFWWCEDNPSLSAKPSLFSKL